MLSPRVCVGRSGPLQSSKHLLDIEASSCSPLPSSSFKGPNPGGGGENCVVPPLCPHTFCLSFQEALRISEAGIPMKARVYTRGDLPEDRERDSTHHNVDS